MKEKRIVFAGVDYWNRPIFLRVPEEGEVTRYFYGCTDKLFDYQASEDEVLEKITVSDLKLFGNRFGCEPEGLPCPEGLTIITRKEYDDEKALRKARRGICIDDSN